MATIADIWAAYEQARGSWSGCDWPTRFGLLSLDLEGVCCLQARAAVRRWRAIAGGHAAAHAVSAREGATLARMALCLRLRSRLVWIVEGGLSVPRLAPRPTRRTCAEMLAQEWDFAACVLEEIEADASLAEREAWAAVRSAERGDWEDAQQHAGRAATLEAGYHVPRLWCRLKAVIEAAAGRDQAAARPRDSLPPTGPRCDLDDATA
jgi:hypothetical protein